jgi:hypothetical protein
VGREQKGTDCIEVFDRFDDLPILIRDQQHPQSFSRTTISLLDRSFTFKREWSMENRHTAQEQKYVMQLQYGFSVFSIPLGWLVPPYRNLDLDHV